MDFIGFPCCKVLSERVYQRRSLLRLSMLTKGPDRCTDTLATKVRGRRLPCQSLHFGVLATGSPDSRDTHADGPREHLEDTAQALTGRVELDHFLADPPGNPNLPHSRSRRHVRIGVHFLRRSCNTWQA